MSSARSEINALAIFDMNCHQSSLVSKLRQLEPKTMIPLNIIHVMGHFKHCCTQKIVVLAGIEDFSFTGKGKPVE